jgi:hypothetical protein
MYEYVYGYICTPILIFIQKHAYLMVEIDDDNVFLIEKITTCGLQNLSPY